MFVGIAAVVALLSLGNGLEHAIQEQFAKIGSDKIYITSKAQFAPVGIAGSGALTTTDLHAVRRTAGVLAATGLLNIPGPISLKNERQPVLVSSIPDDASRELAIQAQGQSLQEGNWPRAHSADVVIGNDLAKKTILSRQVRMGDRLVLNGTRVSVVGILDKIGDPGSDSAIFLGEDTLRNLFDVAQDTFTVIVAQVTPNANVGAAITQTLRQKHNVRKGNEDFDVQTPEDILKTFQNVFLIVQSVLVGIAAVALLVGGIGIMNTMYTAVLERTREIGILKAVGARQKDILLLYVTESGTLGLAGGLLGVTTGFALSYLVSYLAGLYYGSPLIQAQFSLPLLIGMLLFSFSVGAVSGVAPAYRASRMRPVEALRR